MPDGKPDGCRTGRLMDAGREADGCRTESLMDAGRESCWILLMEAKRDTFHSFSLQFTVNLKSVLMCSTYIMSISAGELCDIC